MAAADRTERFQFWQFIAHLTQLIVHRPRPRLSEPRDAQKSRYGRPLQVDLGDLPVALVHDLRNQMMVVLGCVDNLTEVIPSGESDENIAQLKRSAGRALMLTRELVTASSPRSAVRIPIDLNDVVASAVETLSRVTRDRIVVRLHRAAEAVPVSAELIELERIVLNLGLNACEAIAGNGVVTIETAVGEHVAAGIDTTVTGPYGRLTVSDTGHGITPEVEARIFEPFFTTKASGTGLGLSSVAFTVQQLHGRVFVESRPDRGTSVSVILPLATASPRTSFR